MAVKKCVLRCYGERKDGQWTVVCLNFCLAAQAETFDEARERLEAQIHSYLQEALVGQDREHADYLLSRRSPPGMWLKYYFAKAVFTVLHVLGRNDRKATHRPFRQTVPLMPAHC